MNGLTLSVRLSRRKICYIIRFILRAPPYDRIEFFIALNWVKIIITWLRTSFSFFFQNSFCNPLFRHLFHFSMIKRRLPTPKNGCPIYESNKLAEKYFVFDWTICNNKKKTLKRQQNKKKKNKLCEYEHDSQTAYHWITLDLWICH